MTTDPGGDGTTHFCRRGSIRNLTAFPSARCRESARLDVPLLIRLGRFHPEGRAAAPVHSPTRADRHRPALRSIRTDEQPALRLKPSSETHGVPATTERPRWDDVELASGVIHVRRGWDAVEGEIAPKRRQGRRDVPIPAVLRDHLLERRMASTGEGRVFASDRHVRSQAERAGRRWTANGHRRLTLHDARHTYASLMIAAGVNARRCPRSWATPNISITLDLYGHLMPGSQAEARLTSTPTSPGDPWLNFRRAFHWPLAAAAERQITVIYCI